MKMKETETPKLARQNEGPESFLANMPLHFYGGKQGHIPFESVN